MAAELNVSLVRLSFPSSTFKRPLHTSHPVWTLRMRNPITGFFLDNPFWISAKFISGSHGYPSGVHASSPWGSPQGE